MQHESPSYRAAQVFTASAYSKMTSVDLKFQKQGNPTGLKVGLYSVDNSDKPIGSALAETIIPAVSIGTSVEGTAVNAPLTYSGLVDGTRYAIVMQLESVTGLTDNDYYLPAVEKCMPLCNARLFTNDGLGWDDWWSKNSLRSYKMVIHVAK